jgi:hypothetical protein
VWSGASITYLADLAAFTQELTERGGFACAAARRARD